MLERHREYVRIVAQELPRSRSAGHVTQVERRVGDLVGTYLTVARVGTPLPPATSAWILVRMVEHLCVQYVLERPGVDRPDLDRDVLVDELVHLTNAHLAPRR